MGFKLSKSFGWTLARDSNPGGGVPAGYSLWKSGTQVWRFGAQRAISPSRT